MKARYINPYTDFGFKKLFGEEANKDLLTDFLNQLLPEKHQIKELNFRNVEQISDLPVERKAIFDIHCKSVTGERFIVEMQKAKVKYFKDRSLFYTTFPIREQAEKGIWDFQLKPIYFIAILDFYYDADQEKAKVKRAVQLKDQDCEVFFDKLEFIFLQMPAFKLQEHELKTKYDKWLYFLKNLEDFNDMPSILKEPIFKKAFSIAEIANFNKQQLDQYEESLMAYRDLLNVMVTKYEEGREEGIKQGVEQGIKQEREARELHFILQSHKAGISSEMIATITGKTIVEIEQILKTHSKS